MINEVIQGDCLEKMKLIQDKSVDLVIIDPPYNIGKDSWDKIDNYYEWMKEVFLELQRVLKDNGSFYFWHNNMPMISKLMNILEEKTNFIFKQMIVWNKRFDGSPRKGFLDGFVEVTDLRNYQKMSEYCLFYTIGEDNTGTHMVNNKISFKPSREYLNKKMKEKGLCYADVDRILHSKGLQTKKSSHAKLFMNPIQKQGRFIGENQYYAIKEELDLEKSYDELFNEFKDLRNKSEEVRLKYEEERNTFNNQKTHHSVWNYDIDKKLGHITPKPVEMIKNIIKHSSNKGDLVLDCFGGSGTTAIACKELGRNFILIEKEEKYCKLSRERLSKVNLSLDNFGSQLQ